MRWSVFRVELNPRQIGFVESTQQCRCIVNPFYQAIASVRSTGDDRLGKSPLVRRKNNPLQFSLLGVRNPRSFEPSSGFQIETLDDGKYKIDIGGQDINLVMNTMNYFTSLTVTPGNLTNGAVTNYTVAFSSHVYVLEKDILTFQFPLTVRFTDTTLRDGSHAQAHQFTSEQVRDTVRALDRAGVEVIEVTHGDGLGGSSFNYGFSHTNELELIAAAREEAQIHEAP